MPHIHTQCHARHGCFKCKQPLLSRCPQRARASRAPSQRGFYRHLTSELLVTPAQPLGHPPTANTTCTYPEHITRNTYAAATVYFTLFGRRVPTAQSGRVTANLFVQRGALKIYRSDCVRRVENTLKYLFAKILYWFHANRPEMLQ